MCTFKGVLVNDEEIVHLHLFPEGGLMRGCAAGEQLAGADAAGQGLGTKHTHHPPQKQTRCWQHQGRGISQDQGTKAECEHGKLQVAGARLKSQRASERTHGLRIRLQIPYGTDTAVQNTRSSGPLKVIGTMMSSQQS